MTLKKKMLHNGKTEMFIPDSIDRYLKCHGAKCQKPMRKVKLLDFLDFVFMIYVILDRERERGTNSSRPDTYII